MRFLFAIALSVSSAFALKNADFNPVNFVAEGGVATTLNETFSTFRWKGDKAYAKESFEVNIDTPARVQVTDYKNRGDMFEIFDNGKSLGTTSKVDGKKDEDIFAGTPEEALLDERFSKGTFDLAAGKHKITVKAVGPYEAGTAAIRVLDQGITSTGFYKKGGDEDDDEEEDGEGGDEKKWHKGGDDDEGDKKWKDKHPTSEEIDLEHTITKTKTKWIVHKPTYIPGL